MNVISIDIDQRELESFNKKLKSMRRSAFPGAIRQTLNDMAADVYKNTMPAEYKKNFIVRNRTFLKSHSGWDKATGWDISQMESRVGITPRGDKPAENLTNQEFGKPQKDPLVYSSFSRGLKSVNPQSKRTVRNDNFATSRPWIYGGVGQSTKRGRKSSFVAAAIMAKKTNSFLLWQTKKAKTLIKVNDYSFGDGGKKRGFKLDSINIAVVDSGMTHKFNKRAFLYPASMYSQKKAVRFYIDNASYAIKKYMNK